MSQGHTAYFLALVFFTLGLLSKSMIVTLPALLLLLDYWPLKRLPLPESGGQRPGSRVWLGLVLEKIPFLVLSAGACLATMLTQKNVVLTAQHASLFWRIGNVLIAYTDYLGHIFYPVGLAVVYPHSEANPPIFAVAAAGLLLLIITVGTVMARRRHPYLLVGWLWFLGMLLPVIDSMQATQNSRADRYTYLPQIGVCIFVTWGVAALASQWRQRRLALTAGATVVLAALMADAYVQTGYWRDSRSVWSRTLACTTNNYFAENCLGGVLCNADRWNEAVPHLQRALAIKPDYSEAHINLGITFFNQGKSDEASQQFQEVLQLNPNSAEACYGLGCTLASEGKAEDAISYLTRAVQLKPDYTKAQYDLGLALAGEGKWNEAIPHYELALNLKLDQATAEYVTGVAMAGHEKWAKASELYEEALQAKPDFAEAHYRLGIALAKQAKLTEAAGHFQKSLALATRQGKAELAQSARAELGSNAPASPLSPGRNSSE
jgi:tetratricopeptide (TPR) repeat protein